MATGSLGSLVVSLTAETAQFTAALDKASYVADKNFKQISSFAKTAAGSLAALYGVGSLVGFVKQQIDLADATGKMAQKVGLSVTELSKLQYAAKLADVDSAGLQTGLVKLSKGMVEAANGGGQLRNALSAMGLSVKNTDGSMKSSGALLGEVANKFASYEDGVNKTNLAVQVFGKSGADLIPLLNGGADAIANAGDELERFGAVISEKAAQNAEVFNDNLTRLATVGSAFGKSIANEVMPYLNQLAEEFLIARANGVTFMEMLSMGLRSTDYQKHLAEIEDEINSVNKAWAFPIGASRDERLASLEKQKKTLIDVQTLMMQDQQAGPSKKLMNFGGNTSAPLSRDLEKIQAEADKYAKGLGRAQDANDKFIASMREMSQKDQLNIDLAFMSEPQKKLVQDMISINKSFLDTQAEVSKQYAEGRLTLKDYNDQANILSGTYVYAIEQAQIMKETQDGLNGSWSYGATSALNDYANQASNVAKQVEGAFSRVTKGMEDGLVDFVMNGKMNFSSLANSMIADMVRIMIQQSITAPLAKAGASFFGGMFGDTGTMDSSVPNGGGSFSGAEFQLQANGGAWDSGIQKFAKGGAFTNSVVSQPTLFKFAKGTGMMGEAGPEAIMPLSRDASGRLGVKSLGGGGGGNVININVNNNAAGDGYEAVATAKKNENGIDIELMVRKAMSQDLRSNGQISQQMSTTFGLRRSA